MKVRILMKKIAVFLTLTLVISAAERLPLQAQEIQPSVQAETDEKSFPNSEPNFPPLTDDVAERIGQIIDETAQEAAESAFADGMAFGKHEAFRVFEKERASLSKSRSFWRMASLAQSAVIFAAVFTGFYMRR